MAKRGRKKKPILSVEEQEDIVLEKYLTQQPMSLEETSLALWMINGRKGKPLSKMGVLKIEQNALLKLRKVLIQMGYDANEVCGLINDRSRTWAKAVGV